MALVEINWRPSPSELRKFGIAMIVGFGVLTTLAYLWWDAPTAALVLACVGAGAGVLGLTGTRLALVVYLPWMGIAYVVGNIMSRVLVAVFFFGMITPFGLVMRYVLRRDKLQLRNRRKSYWDDLPPPPPPSQYERQF